MKITLLGLEFDNDNMGCQALAYSFLNIVEEIARESHIDIEFTAIVFSSKSVISFSNSDVKISCIKICPKKVSFWRQIISSFQSSHLVVDFTGGDSFSDIYGTKRFYIASLIKWLAIESGTPFMLGPQTYGPFKKRLCQRIASKIIQRSKWVFARDTISCKLAQEISHRPVELTTDVAFSLPYISNEFAKTGNKVRVGINISGLLWSGGYSSSQIEMQTNYKDYCQRVVDYLSKSDMYDVYFVPHVGVSPSDGYESDYNAAYALHLLYPNTTIIENLLTPIDAKNIISSMDVFIGARMHTTIASFSAGVATIPFSYSRKFEGLFTDLHYEYLISGVTNTTDESVEKSIEWISNYKQLTEAVNSSLLRAHGMQESFKRRMTEILEETNG